MTNLALIASSFLLILILAQSLMARRFVQALKRFDVPLIDDASAPPAIVILCLRGIDPFLADCLRGLLRQDYPRYDIRIVVDGPDDPADSLLKELLRDMEVQNVQVEYLTAPSPTCSLKCSALRQVVRSLSPECEIVAQIDADTVPHQTWLRELVTGLQPDDVGAVTGNRWYMPNTPSTGAMVRYTWNAAAVVQMYAYRIAWGGTLATKASVLRESDLLERWGNAFCEDTMLHPELKKLGLRLAFVPSLIMINRENISLRRFFSWVTRQLMTTRLYHPAWKAIVGHALLSAVLPAIACTLLTSAISNDEPLAIAIAILSATLLVYTCSIVLSLLATVREIRTIVARRGQPVRWLPPIGYLKLAAVLPLTQIVYSVALINASLARKLHWRGIVYHVEGPGKIRMEEYLPYQPPQLELAEDSL